MCNIPCSKFVWLSKPQLQQAKTVSQNQKLQSLVPKDCQLSGTVLVFAGEIAKIMLQFALQSQSFYNCNKNMETLQMAECYCALYVQRMLKKQTGQPVPVQPKKEKEKKIIEPGLCVLNTT